ncbi:unnamed protein product [Rotaria magnacalcarata]|uniref:Uncharacterized protein n=5 Tax=Rotaria magnacalcarata TaxID=392030 RepID=A0A816QUL6_9BILA|nr:unnamed protein product [Rotaria magnacalcarata]CAF1618181.1 unnamed protein product [Rotaria magnacalcarata]CAF1932304.1 unnamed protein product [Rotaria magnacalcarata]CAF2066490.1 unnamed protein product [Rotaria magnacalcarata]CAF2068600.1 unnamed protein product [Rotaria magnacalcarata]
MEQTLNFLLKNHTYFSRNYDDESLLEEQTAITAGYPFTGSELHYTIPFWIGSIVISLLFLSAIIASIRYCFYTLYLSHTETEKITLVPPKSPCLTSAANSIQRQRHPLPINFSHHPSVVDHEKSFTFSEESKDHRSNISIIPVVRQHSRPRFTPSHKLTQHHHTDIDTKDIDKHNFSSIQQSHSRGSIDFRKKVHGIYILPVSPTLSSSSSTTNTDEMIKNGSSTMPIRSLRHISSTVNVHDDLTCRGIKNISFADSPQPKDRTLPRSHGSTLRRVQPPSQPPPLPPAVSKLHFNDICSSINFNNNEKSSFQHQSATIDLDHDAIALRFSSQKIYGRLEENPLKKSAPPPVPCRTQKPTVLPIGFEGLTKAQPDPIGFRIAIESSPQDDYSEHTWPKPPDSMTTSEISGPPQPILPSIPYDRLHHDHLIPTVLMRQNSTNHFFHHHKFGENSMLTESET